MRIFHWPKHRQLPPTRQRPAHPPRRTRAFRAGALGKCFAVVASEVKELACEAATATDDIRSKISGVQESTSETIAGISGVASVVNDVHAIVSTIAASIAKQSRITEEIAINIARASAEAAKQSS